LPDIHITSLGGLGDGIAELDGKPVFVEKAAVGDQLRVRITQQTKEFLRAEILDILEAGKERIIAPCPHFSACGGCSLQHLTEAAYQGLKHKIMHDALAHAGFADAPREMIFLEAASRRRSELKWDGARFAYYASRTRDLVAIEQCLILEPVLQSLLTPLAEALAGWHATRAIKTVHLTAADSGIDMVLECSSIVENTDTLSELAERLNLARVSLSAPDQKHLVVVNRAPVTMRLGGYDIALPQGAFLQATKQGQRLLTDAVINGLGEAKSVADLFCGIGTYSFALARSIKRHAVESDGDMVRGLKTMVHLHGLQRHFTTAMRDLFKHPLTASELNKFDAVILNPPRPGAKAQVEEIAKSRVGHVVMVSCSPASFARDAKTLKNAGFSMVSAQGIDQFVYSPHLEIVCVFSRESGNPDLTY
jgi:23S rRNA (uracil1939-C5)-methyltransferase